MTAGKFSTFYKGVFNMWKLIEIYEHHDLVDLMNKHSLKKDDVMFIRSVYIDGHIAWLYQVDMPEEKPKSRRKKDAD